MIDPKLETLMQQFHSARLAGADTPNARRLGEELNVAFLNTMAAANLAPAVADEIETRFRAITGAPAVAV